MTDPCPHCPDDGHGNPLRRAWGVYVAPTRDGDGQPTTLHVAPSNGAHVAQSDAEWLRALIDGDQTSASQIVDELLGPLNAQIGVAEYEQGEAAKVAALAEAAVNRVLELHSESPYKLGHCYCANPYPCPTIRALDEPAPPRSIPGAAVIDPELRALFDDLDETVRSASAAMEAGDMQAWAGHAARCVDLYEAALAQRFGWREQTGGGNG